MTEPYNASKLALLIIKMKECVSDLAQYSEEISNILGITMPHDIYIPPNKDLLDMEKFEKQLEIRRKQYIRELKKEEAKFLDLSKFKREKKPEWKLDSSGEKIPKWLWNDLKKVK